MIGKDFAEKHIGKKIIFKENGKQGIICGYGINKRADHFCYKPDDANAGFPSKLFTKDYIFLIECSYFFASSVKAFDAKYKFIDNNQNKKIIDYPHKCMCGSPAAILATTIDCSNSKCVNYKRGFSDQDSKKSALDLMGYKS